MEVRRVWSECKLTGLANNSKLITLKAVVVREPLNPLEFSPAIACIN